MTGRVATQVLPARQSYPILNGEQIAVALEAAGIDPRGVLDILVTAQVSQRHLTTILALNGPLVDPGETVWSAWEALAESVATGMTETEARRWRSLGLGDAAIALLRENLSWEVVAAMLAVDQEYSQVMDVWLSLTRKAGIPDEELPGWAAAGMLPMFPTSPDGVVREISRWRHRLGNRAVRWAEAGMSLDEATRLNTDGWYDPQALAVMAGLRTGTSHTGARAA